MVRDFQVKNPECISGIWSAGTPGSSAYSKYGLYYAYLHLNATELHLSKPVYRLSFLSFRLERKRKEKSLKGHDWRKLFLSKPQAIPPRP
jgi:hypothetical protein